MQQNLAETFRESADAAHLAFRWPLVRLVVVAKNADQPVYVAPEIADLLTQNTADVARLMREAKEYIARRNAGGFASRFEKVAGQPVQLIAVNDAPPGMYGPNNTPEMRAAFVLDHELGHYVVKRGVVSGTVGESAADAFAALRHIQRHGLNAEFFAHVSRPAMMALGHSTIHYTSAAIERVWETAQKTDVTKLTLQETAVLADEIAHATSLSAETRSKLDNAFAPAVEAYRRAFGSREGVLEKFYAQDPAAYALFVSETQKVIDGSMDPEVLKAAQGFLDYPPVKKFRAGTPAPSKQQFAMVP